MSQKRQTEEDSGSSGSGEKRQKGATFRGLVMDVMRANKIQNLLSMLEPMLRRIVKEEVEQALATHLINIKRQCEIQVYPSSSRSLQLHFRTMLCHPIFTGTKIEGEGGSLIVALVDALTGYVVTSGPESSLAVEIVVLEGDFEGDKDDNWTFEEFKNYIVREREGKRSLLAGDTILNLREGTGMANDLSLTDNSSWTRSRKFRLGAKVENGHFNGIRIKEAKTEPFVVKDHRGELYKKHYPPSLEDDVWRLEKIGKDGAFHKRLSRENINTVQEFLMLLSIDAPRLRNILGSGMSTKMWEITVEHARKCVLTKQMYVYYDDGQRRSGVVYDVIGELKGLISEQQYISVTNLSDIQKADAFKLLKVAYKYPREVYPRTVEDGSSLSHSPIPDGSSPQLNFYDGCSSSQRADIFGGSVSRVSTPDVLSLFAMDDFRDHPTCTASFFHRDAYKPFSPLFEEESRDQLFGDDQSQYFAFDQCLQPDNVSVDSSTDLGTVVAEYIESHSNLSDKKSKVTNAFDVVATKPVTIGWGTLLSVLSWMFSIKRIVALKRTDLKKI